MHLGSFSSLVFIQIAHLILGYTPPLSFSLSLSPSLPAYAYSKSTEGLELGGSGSTQMGAAAVQVADEARR